MTDEFKKAMDNFSEDMKAICWCAGSTCSGCELKTKQIVDRTASWAHDEILNSAEMKGLMDWLDDNMAPDCDCRQCVLFAAFKARFNVGVGK